MEQQRLCPPTDTSISNNLDYSQDLAQNFRIPASLSVGSNKLSGPSRTAKTYRTASKIIPQEVKESLPERIKSAVNSFIHRNFSPATFHVPVSREGDVQYSSTQQNIVSFLEHIVPSDVGVQDLDTLMTIMKTLIQRGYLQDVSIEQKTYQLPTGQEVLYIEIDGVLAYIANDTSIDSTPLHVQYFEKRRKLPEKNKQERRLKNGFNLDYNPPFFVVVSYGDKPLSKTR